MIGRFAVELLDIFSEVGLDALDAVVFEEVVQLELFGDHALAFHDGAAALFLTDGEDLGECLVGILCPDDASASFCEDGFELFELFVEGFQCAPFYVLSSFAGEVELSKLLFALWDHGVVPTNVEVDLFPVVQIFCLDCAAGDEISCRIGHLMKFRD